MKKIVFIGLLILITACSTPETHVDEILGFKLYENAKKHFPTDIYFDMETRTTVLDEISKAEVELTGAKLRNFDFAVLFFSETNSVHSIRAIKRLDEEKTSYCLDEVLPNYIKSYEKKFDITMSKYEPLSLGAAKGKYFYDSKKNLLLITCKKEDNYNYVEVSLSTPLYMTKSSEYLEGAL